jgi:chromosome segregation ATPase
VDYFSPGLREFGRKICRGIARLRISVRSRELAKAEAELGLLGWQQADYDEDTQRQVQEIYAVEQEQSRLTNEAAALYTEVRLEQSRRETVRKEFEDEKQKLQAAEKKVLDMRPQVERQLAEKRKVEPNFEKKIPALDRELRDVQKRYAALLAVEQHTAASRNEMILLRERSVAIPNEKSDLRTQHLRAASEIRALETILEQEESEIAALHQQVKELEHRWSETDHEIQAGIRNREKKKEAIEKRIQALESAKFDPYKRIGRVLADNQIAPLNQPEALRKVHTLRFRIAELQQKISDSEAATAQEAGQLMQASMMLWVGIVVVVVVILLAALT